ncbi:MAG: hypothetical protein H0Z24_03485 [Thermosipho sp. (in: Bacteria)]|nr:hypothetical protein [Thermosipho sp. (in: thermotogales)]
MKKLIFFLKDERGQMLPFLAIALLIIMAFGALGIGYADIYKDRSNIRDALDAAASAALSPARKKSKPTYYGERYRPPKYQYYDNSTNPPTPLIPPVLISPGYWYKVTGNERDYIDLDIGEAQEAAEFYFKKNLALDGMEYKILEWDLDIDFEQRPLQVVKQRQNTEGVVTTWEENFPRWVSATLNVRLEMPVAWGTIVKNETIKTRLSTQTVKELR